MSFPPSSPAPAARIERTRDHPREQRTRRRATRSIVVRYVSSSAYALLSLTKSRAPKRHRATRRTDANDQHLPGAGPLPRGTGSSACKRGSHVLVGDRPPADLRRPPRKQAIAAAWRIAAAAKNSLVPFPKCAALPPEIASRTPNTAGANAYVACA